MATVPEATIRSQLVERREKLQDFVGHCQPPQLSELESLLQSVDTALARLDDGSYGLCEVCHDPVEAERLLADPLACRCIDHLTKDEMSGLERDLDLAGRVQSALLPDKSLDIEGWQVGFVYQPASRVSGDYFDLIQPPTPGGDTLLLFGDVSGKGMPASLLMSNLNAIFRSLGSLELPLEELVGRANRVFCESTLSSSYATLVCGRASPTGRVELVNAGHCPPILVTGAGARELPATGVPIGMFCGGCFGRSAVQLNPGDLLVLYTDGLSEANNPAGEEFGARRVATSLAGVRGDSPDAVVGRLVGEVTAFCAGASLQDDLALMVLRRAGDAD